MAKTITPEQQKQLNENHEMAKEAAKVMIQSMSGMPNPVQFEAAAMLMQALFITGLKPEARLRHFGEICNAMRFEIKKSLKEKQAHGVQKLQS